MDLFNSKSSDLRSLIQKIPSFENISRICDILRGCLEEYADDENLDKVSNIEILEKSVHYWKWIYPLIQSGKIDQYQTLFEKVDPGLCEELNVLLVLFDDKFTTPFVLREVNTDIVSLIDEFLQSIELQKEELISTGCRRFNLTRSPWFSYNLSDILITRIPELSFLNPTYDYMEMDESSQASQKHENIPIIYDWGTKIYENCTPPDEELENRYWNENGDHCIVHLEYEDVDPISQFLLIDEDTIRSYRNQLFDFKIDLLNQIRNRSLDEKQLIKILDQHFDEATQRKLFQIDLEYENLLPKFSGGGLFSIITCAWAIHIAKSTDCYGEVLEALNLDQVNPPIHSSDILVACDSKFDDVCSVIKRFIGEWADYFDMIEGIFGIPIPYPFRFEAYYDIKNLNTVIHYIDYCRHAGTQSEEINEYLKNPTQYRRKRNLSSEDYAFLYLSDKKKWIIKFERKTCYFEDNCKGYWDIFNILNHSYAGEGPRNKIPAGQFDRFYAIHDHAIPNDNVYGSDQVYDRKLINSSQERLNEINIEIENAKIYHECEKIEELEEEKKKIESYICKNTNIKNEPRLLNNENDRVRKKISKRIKTAIQKIAEQNQALGEHFKDSIQCGYHFFYEPKEEIYWYCKKIKEKSDQ